MKVNHMLNLSTKDLELVHYKKHTHNMYLQTEPTTTTIG